jgi:ABC-type bacteriocin/lantibiotic exporter with double-glycine peptidase domain
MKCKFVDLLDKQVFGGALLLLLIQQGIVASSSIWISGLIIAIQEAQNPLAWLGLYMISLFLPYPPGAASLVVLEKGQALLAIRYVQVFKENWKGKVLHWSDRRQHSRTTSLLTGESTHALQAYLSYIYQMTSCLLNVALNLLVISLIIDWVYIFSFSAGLFLAGMALRMQQRRKATLSLQAQQERIRWAEILLNLWDNVLLNNPLNIRIWSSLFSERGKRLVLSAVGLERFSQTISVTLALLLLSPTFVAVVVLVVRHLQDPIFLGLIAVTLPRLFQLLAYAYEFLFLVSSFPTQKTQVQTILDAMSPDDEQSNKLSSIEHRVHWDQLRCSRSDGTLQNLEELRAAIPVKGRLTLRGPNGSGKTSLLLLLKHQYGDRAFFLPAHHTLEFENVPDGASTGQRARALLRELRAGADGSILLLDEWDANLDTQAAQELSEHIDAISQTACVIEARHRTG